MDKTVNIPRINRVAVSLALFYAFSTRSIIGSFIYRGVLLWVFYGALFLSLGICLVNSFGHEGSHLYAPKYFFSTFLLLIVIVFGLIQTGSMNSLLYYGIAVLLPFALLPGIKNTKGISVAFVIIGVVLFIGCLINYLFPTAYRITILPLFSEYAQSGLNWQAEFGTFFPGFTSQVGYTSFFLCMAFGALFCFRKTIFRRCFIPLAIILIMGLLLTGKRAPTVFLLVCVLLLYFYESRGRERFVKVFQIILIAVAAYVVLFMIARLTNNPAINRIFESIRDMIITRDVEDAGRNQLWNQAKEYFSDNIIFGIGWTNFKNLFTLRHTHVHNIYLQLLCETGIVGFLIFAGFFVNNFRLAMLKIKKAIPNTIEYSWLMLSLFIQLYFLLYGITGNPLYDVEETILYFFGVGISFLPMLADLEESE